MKSIFHGSFLASISSMVWLMHIKKLTISNSMRKGIEVNVNKVLKFSPLIWRFGAN